MPRVATWTTVPGKPASAIDQVAAAAQDEQRFRALVRGPDRGDEFRLGAGPHEAAGGPTHSERGEASQQHLVTDGWHRQS